MPEKREGMEERNTGIYLKGNCVGYSINLMSLLIYAALFHLNFPYVLIWQLDWILSTFLSPLKFCDFEDCLGDSHILISVFTHVYLFVCLINPYFHHPMS